MQERKPLQLFDKEALEGLGEVMVGLGMLALAAVIFFRKHKPEPQTIIINIEK